MFLVDDTRKERSEKIRSLIDSDLSLAALSAVLDFEWTLRRCILALGKSPTMTIRMEILDKATFKDYTRIWNEEVYPSVKIKLKDLLPDFKINDKHIFTLRNRIFQGELEAYGFVKFHYTKLDVEMILSASEKLTKFAEEKNKPIYDRRIIRNKKNMRNL